MLGAQVAVVGAAPAGLPPGAQPRREGMEQHRGRGWPTTAPAGAVAPQRRAWWRAMKSRYQWALSLGRRSRVS
jgi:hypothetical protein